MITLAVESSATPVSVALVEDGKIIAENYIHTRQTHSETLMPMLQSLLQTSGKTMSEVNLLAVSAGPGSFTGVRIGVATVKGLSFPDNIPCAPVSTLEAIAYGAAVKNGVVCAVMDARCQQVYHANFKAENGKLTRLCEDRAISIEELSKECQSISDSVVLCGDGADLCYTAFHEWGAVLSDENVKFQRASSVALLAEKIYTNQKTVSGTDLVPFYLRLPQAERERKKRLEGVKS